MAGSTPQQQQQSASQRFVRGAGETNTANLWGPARWIVQMIQSLVALIMVTVAEGIKAIFTGGSSSRRRNAAGNSSQRGQPGMGKKTA